MPKAKNIVSKLKDEAWNIVNNGGKLAAIYKGKDFFIYKKGPQDLFKVAYICPNCSHNGQLEANLEPPYILKCANCSNLIYKQQKVPGKRGRKRKEK